MDDVDVGDCSTDGSCAEEGGGDEAAGIGAVNEPKATLLEASALALQQFSIVVGVALMVGMLFFLMIAVEVSIDWVLSKLSEKCCKKSRDDIEDPAALVGSFKRYKN